MMVEQSNAIGSNSQGKSKQERASASVAREEGARWSVSECAQARGSTYGLELNTAATIYTNRPAKE